MKLTTALALATLLTLGSAFKNRGPNQPAVVEYTCDTTGGSCNENQLRDAILNRCQALGGDKLYKNGIDMHLNYNEPGHVLKGAWSICLCAHGNIKSPQDYHFDEVEPHGLVHIEVSQYGTSFNTCQWRGGGLQQDMSRPNWPY